MAQRRMFSPDIVCSDAFLEMPVSAQALYFHLAMKADDDGFVSPRSTMRLVGAGEDDLKVLLAKRFVLPFESGVVVIKHWLIHNLIRADLYKETLYKKEKAILGLNENGAYTELREGVSEIKPIEAPKWLKARRGDVRTANVPQTVHRLGKDRIGNTPVANAPGFEVIKVSEENERPKKEPRADLEYEELCKWLENLTGAKIINRKKQYAFLKKAKAAEISKTRLKNRAEELFLKPFHQENGLDWGMVVSSFDRKA